MVFDPLTIELGGHAVKRWIERSNKDFSSYEEAADDLLKTVHQSSILIENNFYRYYIYDDFIFPCGFVPNSHNRLLRIVTVLTKDMVIDRFDETMEKYIIGALI